MATRNFLDRVKALSGEQKLVFYGSLTMALSAVMPWYSDLDSFRTGDTFLGLTGPMYLVGLLFLGLGGVACATLFSRSVRDKIDQLFSSLGNFYMIAAGFSAFLLLLTNSVFFHPRFGVNVVIKETRFGMLFALGGVILLGVGAYFMRKRQHRHGHLDLESTYEPLIKMPEPREHAPAGVKREHGVIENVRHDVEREVEQTERSQHTLL